MPTATTASAGSQIDVLTCEADPRFAFAWHSSAREPGAPLLVAVHGSERDFRETCAAFVSLAEQFPMSILAPHFPVGAGEPGYGDGYKFFDEGNVDYPALTLAMIAQFNRQVIETRPSFYLFGFSGGAQFAHRFAYFEANRLDGMIAAAPGAVTLPDENLQWWPGLANAEAAMGRPADLAALGRIPVAVTVGSDDLSAGLLRRDPSERNGSINAELAGTTRVERARSLHTALRKLGVASQFVQISGAGHELGANAEVASDILGGWMAARSLATHEPN
jgi:pimeloyl-ACP methyl ester carboxylesterase